ncbi:PA domain-containing protein, partial [Priestia megaterium]|uniref:PA domain-containing protein n=1 Tax=Priestia megaterium TaxID=1404 RepID=UPI0035B6A46F
DADSSLTGDTRFLGLACDPATIPLADDTASVAVIERGGCTFTEKVLNAQAAGYEGAIVFNSVGGCDELVSMLVEADIPAVFVS